jgi:tetratricopeptide (TPR) repeat protein
MPKASAFSSDRWPSGARSVTGPGKRRRRITWRMPISGSGGRPRLLTCTGARWSWNHEVGNRYGEGVALVNVGWTLLDLDRAGEAVDPLLQARQTFAEISYLDGAGYALHILGRCYLSLDRDAEALSCLQEALTSHRTTGNRRRQAATLRSLGTAQSRVGQAAEARESWDQAAVIFTELGDRAEAEEVRAEQAESGIS